MSDGADSRQRKEDQEQVEGPRFLNVDDNFLNVDDNRSGSGLSKETRRSVNAGGNRREELPDDETIKWIFDWKG